MSFFFDPVLLIAVVANTLLSAVVPRAICRWCRASAISDLLLNFNKKKSRASETTKLKMLVDSGTSGNVVSGKHIPKAHCKKDEQTKWNTQGGAFKTKSKSKIFFGLPGGSISARVQHCGRQFQHNEQHPQKYPRRRTVQTQERLLLNRLGDLHLEDYTRDIQTIPFRKCFWQPFSQQPPPRDTWICRQDRAGRASSCSSLPIA